MSARGTTVLLADAELFARFGSAIALEMMLAVFARAPPSPPGRICTTNVGQFTSVVQGGRFGIVQVMLTLVLLVTEGAPQLALPAMFAFTVALTKPAPVAPVALLISVVRLSMIVMLVDACTGALFTTSSVYVSTSPALTLARSTVLLMEMSAEFGPVLDPTLKFVLLLPTLGSVTFAPVVVISPLTLMAPVPVVNSVHTTDGVFVPDARGETDVYVRVHTMSTGHACATGEQAQPFTT